MFSALNVPAAWDYKRGGFAIPKGRVDDVLAALELAGHTADYEAALW